MAMLTCKTTLNRHRSPMKVSNHTWMESCNVCMESLTLFICRLNRIVISFCPSLPRTSSSINTCLSQRKRATFLAVNSYFSILMRICDSVLLHLHCIGQALWRTSTAVRKLFPFREISLRSNFSWSATSI